MTRADSRRELKKKDPTYNMKQSQIDAIKEQEFKKGVDTAFVLMLAIPNMVIHDKFGMLMKKDGREQRFVEEVIKLYELYNEGYVTLAELQQCLEEETGVKIERTRK